MTSLDKATACDTAEKIGHKVRELCEHAGVELRDVRNHLERKIHQKPVPASLAALGVGLILGLLITRS